MHVPTLTLTALRRVGARLLLAAAALAAAGCASLPPPNEIDRPITKAIPGSTATRLGQIAAVSSPAPELTGFRLMPIGSFALNTRITLIERAQASLDLQYYHLHDDQTGRYLLRKLRDAAVRGVRVRLLLDDLYTGGMDPLLLGLAAHPNVEIRLFNPFTAARDNGLITRLLVHLPQFGRINHRMHNKLFIADGVMAIAGGRNIADEYFMRNMSANFVDLDAFITGAVLPELQRLYDHYWNSDFVYPLHRIVPPREPPEALRARFDRLTGPDTTPLPEEPPVNDVLGYGPIAHELDDGRLGLIWAEAHAYADVPEKIRGMVKMYGVVPIEDVDSVRYNVVEQMRRARQEVVMTTPYLIPGPAGMEVFREVRRRGVSVRVLTNSLAATDEPIVHTAYRRYRPEMLRIGIDLYELSPTRVKRNLRLGMFGASHGRLHAKTAVIDRRTVFIGSMNFDPRSDKHNTEMAIIVQSPPLAREVLRLMDLDKLQASWRLRLAADGSDRIEWLTTDDDGELVVSTEPDAGLWTRILLNLLAPLAPEELL